MYVKLLPGDLNPYPCALHSTSTYTCGVTIASRVCDEEEIIGYTCISESH